MKDNLGTRMKKNYENITRNYLVSRMPVIIRLDGKSFHTFTKGFKKPFDEIFIQSMQETMQYLCKNIQGCVLGYTQSDEISLILIDYQKLESCGWFDYNIQKMVSVSASMATMTFNRVFSNKVIQYLTSFNGNPLDDKYCMALKTSIENGALFDARCFNIPKEEVCNCILWRQIDAERNSIAATGQAYFSTNKLIFKSSKEVKDMLLEVHKVDWDRFPTYIKYGSCCVKKLIDEARLQWIIDKDIPIFKGEGRKYINDLIYIGENI